MASEEDIESSTLKPQLSQAHIMWKQEMEQNSSQLDALQAKLTELKASICGSEPEAKQELEVLWRRVKATATLLTYLKSKARIMAVPQLAPTSCGIKQLDGVGLVDRNGVPVSGWSRTVDLSSFDAQDSDTCQEGFYIGEIFKSVQMVTDVMESLVKRIIMAESETAIEKEKVTLGEEEIKKKAYEIESMSTKIDEMERFSADTIGALTVMRERVQDLVVETSRQRDRAAENEEELCRVKRDFESLKSYVSSLISVRETLLSSEKQFQTIERLFERSVFYVFAYAFISMVFAAYSIRLGVFGWQIFPWKTWKRCSFSSFGSVDCLIFYSPKKKELWVTWKRVPNAINFEFW